MAHDPDPFTLEAGPNPGPRDHARRNQRLRWLLTTDALAANSIRARRRMNVRRAGAHADLNELILASSSPDPEENSSSARGLARRAMASALRERLETIARQGRRPFSPGADAGRAGSAALDLLSALSLSQTLVDACDNAQNARRPGPSPLEAWAPRGPSRSMRR